MDRTADCAEKGRLRCGSLTVRRDGSPNTGTARLTKDTAGHRFRACVQIAGGSTECEKRR